jgi:CxxC motif-containing protein (DUF1111 family)
MDFGRVGWRITGVLTTLAALALGADRGREPRRLISRDVFEGKALFEKTWQPGAPSPSGGDGLGPLYNETSCVACHHQGGTGGGGENSRNVLLVTAVAAKALPAVREKPFHGSLEDLHPAFHGKASIVLHRHATKPEIQARLSQVETFNEVRTGDQTLALRHARRNTPALFGAGLIDAIPQEVLRAAEKNRSPNFPEIRGRTSELPDGRLGRFGWKAQIASLDDFVRAACSNELGLEVPGHHQASLPPVSDFDLSQPALDLDEAQCALLTGFVRRLAPPVRRSPGGRTVPPWGYSVFESIGCARCHAPQLGNVSGIFSDLLLHDMGEASSDAATYYGSPPGPRLDDLAKTKSLTPPSGMSSATEWRTAPLWGVADSAPYLHDGRADTLDEAIRLHGGEATKTTTRYARLASSDRKALLSFLASLTVSPHPKPRKPPLATRRAPPTARKSGQIPSIKGI